METKTVEKENQVTKDDNYYFVYCNRCGTKFGYQNKAAILNGLGRPVLAELFFCPHCSINMCMLTYLDSQTNAEIKYCFYSDREQLLKQREREPHTREIIRRAYMNNEVASNN